MQNGVFKRRLALEIIEHFLAILSEADWYSDARFGERALQQQRVAQIVFGNENRQRRLHSAGRSREIHFSA